MVGHTPAYTVPTSELEIPLPHHFWDSAYGPGAHIPSEDELDPDNRPSAKGGSGWLIRPTRSVATASATIVWWTSMGITQSTGTTFVGNTTLTPVAGNANGNIVGTCLVSPTTTPYNGSFQGFAIPSLF